MNKYMTEVETGILKWYAKKAKLGIVEIGVLNGETTRELAKASTVPVYGIDPFIPDSMDKSLVGSIEQVNKNTEGLNVQIINKYSHDAVKDFNHPFDMILVDGDHRYEGIEQDIDDWFPKLAPGGLMFLHDSAPVYSVFSDFRGHEGPIKAAKEMNDKHTRIGTWDTLTGFEKEGGDSKDKMVERYTVAYVFPDRKSPIKRIMDGLAKNIGGKARYVFVFDGCSSETEQAVRERFGDLGTSKIETIRTDNVFELAANNILLQSIITDYLIIFQDDMVLEDADMLKNLDACISKYPYSIGVIGCRSGFFNNYADMACSEFDKNGLTKRILSPGKTDVCWMVNRGPIVISAELRRAIGVMDTEYDKGGAYTDMDYCLRAVRAGFINIVMGLRLDHVRIENNGFFNKMDSNSKNIFKQKWPEVQV